MTRNRAKQLRGGGILCVSLLAALAGCSSLLDRTFVLGGSDRFVVRLENGDTASTATIELRVYLDGKQEYRQAATLKNTSIRYLLYNDVL